MRVRGWKRGLGDDGGAAALVTELLTEAGFVVDGALAVPSEAVDIRSALNTGVIGGVAAALLWAMTPTFSTAMPSCVLYVVATIIGERMELARITMAGTQAEKRITLWVLGLAALAFRRRDL